MQSRRHLFAPLLLGTALLLSGCGEPQRVTYVDPNGSSRHDEGGSREPFVDHGADAAVRAQAIVRIRAALAVARTLAHSDRAAAAQVLEATIAEDLPLVEPRLAADAPQLRLRLREQLERLARRPPADQAGYDAAVQQVVSGTLAQARDAVVPVAARQDDGFRAAVLVEIIDEAALRYEEAVAATEEEGLDPVGAYRDAYGLLLDARTRGLDAVPPHARRSVQTRIAKIADMSMPGPTPPRQLTAPEQVTEDLAGVARLVSAAAGIDPVLPPPDPATADQLRSLKGDVARAIGTWERGDRSAAMRQLETAADAQLVPAARGLAAVDPQLLAQVERGMMITLPDAMRRGGDVAAAGAELDGLVDDAIALVESELELRREAEAAA